MKSASLPPQIWILGVAVLIGGWLGAEYGSRRFANPLVRRILAVVLAVGGCENDARMKVFGFAGWSGSGKTTLIEKLIPRFAGAGLRVSLIKHAHHTFDVDQPGKDSYRHRHAGAAEVLVTSSRRWVLMHELRGAAEPSFDDAARSASRRATS